MWCVQTCRLCVLVFLCIFLCIFCTFRYIATLLERFYNLFRFFLFIYALRGFLYIFLYSYITLYCRATGSENAAHT